MAEPLDCRIRKASLLASIPEIQVETTLISLDFVNKIDCSLLLELVLEQLLVIKAAEPRAPTLTKSLLFTPLI